LLERAVGEASPATKLELPTDLGTAYNTVGIVRAALAGHYQRRGYLLRRTGRTGDAVRSFRTSLAALESLLSADPANTNYQAGYASNGATIASLLQFMGRGDEARAVAEKVRPVAEQLIAGNPNVPGYRINLATLLMLQGNLAFKAGQPGDAARRFAEALAIYERLGADDPRNSYYRHRIAAACRHLGSIPAPHIPQAEGLGYLRRAEALLEELPNRDTVSTYDLACTQALIAGRLGAKGAEAAERARYKQRAMGTLRRAFDAGYRDLENIRADTDLEALRPRDDFRQLLAGLEAEARAGPPAEPRTAGR
jgi:tetratricopeptide (TPR) repeat protein